MSKYYTNATRIDKYPSNDTSLDKLLMRHDYIDDLNIL